METINVNVDVTADQITDNTADSLQIEFTKQEEVTDVALENGSTVTGTKTTITLTTLAELRAKSDSLALQISDLQAQKDENDALILSCTDKVSTALNQVIANAAVI